MAMTLPLERGQGVGALSFMGVGAGTWKRNGFGCAAGIGGGVDTVVELPRKGVRGGIGSGIGKRYGGAGFKGIGALGDGCRAAFYGKRNLRRLEELNIYFIGGAAARFIDHHLIRCGISHVVGAPTAGIGRVSNVMRLGVIINPLVRICIGNAGLQRGKLRAAVNIGTQGNSYGHGVVGESCRAAAKPWPAATCFQPLVVPICCGALP